LKPEKKKMFLDTMVEKLHKSLYNNKDALNYLYSRNVLEEDIKKYKLGYSNIVIVPEDKHEDRKRFLDENHNGRKFEKKIIFPLYDAMGRVMGIAGRSIQSKEFKNFVTTEGKTIGFFFGLFQALPYIYKENKAYIVEGYFDCMALSKVFPNTAAAMTAGLSEEQYKYLSMFCDDIITVFDSDDPGQNAAEKAKNLYKTRSFSLGYKDPAKCLETLGLSKFREFVIRKSQEILF